MEAEFPLGDPAGQETPELLATGLRAKFERLSDLSTREQADLAQQTADDLGYRASDASFRHSRYRPETGNYSTGNQILEALVKEAEPAVWYAGDVPPLPDRQKLHGFRHFPTTAISDCVSVRVSVVYHG